jgi:hypothetical protein
MQTFGESDSSLFDGIMPQRPIETRVRGRIRALFCDFLFPRLMPHNVLYDTSYGEAVKTALT